LEELEDKTKDYEDISWKKIRMMLVLKINEGHLCEYLIKKILKIQLQRSGRRYIQVCRFFYYVRIGDK